MNSNFYTLNMLAEHHDHSGVSINTDFLEANVINILLLLFGLIYVLKNFLGLILVDRQKKILLIIQECEESLEQANIRLEESQKQLAQTQVVIRQIQEEAQVTADRVRDAILAQGTIDIAKLTTSSKDSIANAEQQTKRQIRQQIITLAINRVVMQIKSQIDSRVQGSIIDSNILKLGAKL